MKIVTVTIPGDRVIIAPLGDVQYGNPGFSENKFKAAKDRLERLNARIPVRIIGTGDYLDLMSPSNRERYMASGLYAPTKRSFQFSTAWPMVDALYGMWPLSGPKTVALARGHHWFPYTYDDMDDAKAEWALETNQGDSTLPGNTDQHLAILLDAAYVPNTALVRFYFQDHGKTFTVFLWHGQGNGKSFAYGINKMADVVEGWDEVDAVVMGHTHKLAGAASVRLRYDAELNKLVAHNIPLVNAGSFLRGWKLGETLYPEAKGLTPNLALGHPLIHVNAAVQDKEPFEISTELYW